MNVAEDTSVSLRQYQYPSMNHICPNGAIYVRFFKESSARGKINLFQYKLIHRKFKIYITIEKSKCNVFIVY